jgi:biopolymer transport protein TolR
VTKSLEDVLAQSARVQREKELYIRADKNAHYGAVARVVAAARAAGVEGLNLLVEPEPEPEAKR